MEDKGDYVRICKIGHTKKNVYTFNVVLRSGRGGGAWAAMISYYCIGLNDRMGVTIEGHR